MKTGCIVLRVGVGLERMGREADAARRSGVEAFGFSVLASSDTGVVELANRLHAGMDHRA